jgi:hypothetical protein
VPISMSNPPETFQRPNLLMLYGEVAEHAEFDDKRLTLVDKRAWAERHPPGPSHIRLMPPAATGPKRPDSRPPRCRAAMRSSSISLEVPPRDATRAPAGCRPTQWTRGHNSGGGLDGSSWTCCP